LDLKVGEANFRRVQDCRRKLQERMRKWGQAFKTDKQKEKAILP
jgi:hypothetical protein